MGPFRSTPLFSHRLNHQKAHSIGSAVVFTVSCKSSVFLGPLARPVKQRFGFYFPVHDQIEGVVEVLKSARRFYPEAPIYVLQESRKATRSDCYGVGS